MWKVGRYYRANEGKGATVKCLAVDEHGIVTAVCIDTVNPFGHWKFKGQVTTWYPTGWIELPIKQSNRPKIGWL